MVTTCSLITLVNFRKFPWDSDVVLLKTVNSSYQIPSVFFRNLLPFKTVNEIDFTFLEKLLLGTKIILISTLQGSSDG